MIQLRHAENGAYYMGPIIAASYINRADARPDTYRPKALHKTTVLLHGITNCCGHTNNFFAHNIGIFFHRFFISLK
jgi:hypothetical protein